MLFRRPLIPCILAYITGLWLVHDIYHNWPVVAISVFAVLAITCIIVARFYKSATPVYLFALLTLATAVMGVREREAYVARDLVARLDGPAARVIYGTVQTISDIADTERSRIIMKNVSVTSGTTTIRLPGKVQATFDPEAMATSDEIPVPGTRLAFPGYIYAPASLNNFFGYDRREALRHEQVYASARPLDIKGIVRMQRGSAGIRGAITSSLVDTRQRITLALQKSMWPREGRLMIAMLFNDMRRINEQEKQIFRESGTFHLFAVSGMHIAILAVILNLLFRAFRFGLRGSWIATAAVMLLYLWLIDFVPSATRSYLMLVAFTAGYMLRREVDPITSLVFAIATVVAWDPASLWKTGFVLSVAGVASIVLFMPLLRTWIPWPGERPDLTFWGRRAADLMDVTMATFAIAVVMLPLQLYYFGFWNALSPLANLLQAALASIVLSAGVLTAAAALISDSLGQAVGQFGSATMRAVYEISRWAANESWAIFYARQIPTWLMLCGYGVIISGYYLVFRDAPEFNLKSRARFATHACFCVGVLVLFQLYSDWRRPGLEIWALDVGQGDATLLRLPNGETMLIDGGKSSPDMGQLVVVQQLRGLGIKRLDYIVATHDDDDHTGGLASVIRQIGTRHLLIPAGFQSKSRATRQMLDAARAHYCVIHEVAAGHTARAGDALLEVLNPLPINPLSSDDADTSSTFPSVETPAVSDNERSIVLRISYGHFSAILLGDAGIPVETRLLNQNRLSHATIIKAGHHGSKSSTGAELLAATRPTAALISCGSENRFGHPAREVLQRLAHTGTRVFRTDTQGAICIQTDGYKVSIKTRNTRI